MSCIRNGGDRRARWGSSGRAALAAGLALALVLALIVPVGVAFAGRGKGKKATPPERPPKFDNLPTMDFLAGELQHDGRGGWTVEGTPLMFAPGGGLQSARADGAALLPRDGDRGLLMGHWAGRTFVVRQGLIEDAFGGRGSAGAGAAEQRVRGLDPRSEAARDIPQ